MGHARLRTHPADRGTGASTQVSRGCRIPGSLLQPEAMKKFILLLGVAGALALQTFIQMAASSSFSRAWRLAAPEPAAQHDAVGTPPNARRKPITSFDR